MLKKAGLVGISLGFLREFFGFEVEFFGGTGNKRAEIVFLKQRQKIFKTIPGPTGGFEGKFQRNVGD